MSYRAFEIGELAYSQLKKYSRIFVMASPPDVRRRHCDCGKTPLG
jgi:hypothetical protein